MSVRRPDTSIEDCTYCMSCYNGLRYRRAVVLVDAMCLSLPGKTLLDICNHRLSRSYNV